MSDTFLIEVEQLSIWNMFGVVSVKARNREHALEIVSQGMFEESSIDWSGDMDYVGDASKVTVSEIEDE